MGKLSLVVGLAAGYVLGARAGKERYAQIKRGANAVWTSEPVTRKKEDLRIAARTKAGPFVADVIADTAKSAGAALRASAVRGPAGTTRVESQVIPDPDPVI